MHAMQRVTWGWHHFLTGVAAGGAFVVVELLGRVIGGVPTLPELFQDRLILLLPGPVFSFLLGRLFYLGKPLLFVGLLLLQFVLAGLGGVIVACQRQPWALAAILWLVTGVLLLPLAGKGVMAGSASVALVTALSFLAYSLALVSFRVERPPAGGTDRASLAPAPQAQAGWWRFDARRRRLLGGGLLFFASAVLARRLIGGLPQRPGVASSPTGTVPQPLLSEISTENPPAEIPGLPAPVTPIERFYVVSKNITDPQVDLRRWRLRVVGLVDRPLDLQYDDLLAMPAQEVYRTLECISNEVGGDLISNGLWTGVRLADVLGRAGIQPGAAVVHFTSADNYTETMPLVKALAPTTLLAYKLNGETLPVKHGFPVRVLGAGTYGMKNPKWLTRIEVTRSAPVGFWQQQGWSDEAIVQTMARIDTPSQGVAVQGENIFVGGIAFAGDRGIRRVEVSADRGTTWEAAKLLRPLGQETWVLWYFAWRPVATGTSTLLVRSIDGLGQVQTSRRADPFPNGATGYHEVRVRVVG